MRISMDGKGRWVDNVFVERLWRSVKYEEVYLHAYGSIAEANRRLASYFDFYNRIRSHQSLDGMTPDAGVFRRRSDESRRVSRPCTKVGRPERPTSASTRVGGPWVPPTSRRATAVERFVVRSSFPPRRALVCVACATRAPPWKTLAAQFITYPASISVQSDGASAICRRLNLFCEAIVAIDGSKFKAVNNRDKNFTDNKLKKRMAQLEESISRYLAELDRADRDRPWSRKAGCRGSRRRSPRSRRTWST